MISNVIATYVVAAVLYVGLFQPAVTGQTLTATQDSQNAIIPTDLTVNGTVPVQNASVPIGTPDTGSDNICATIACRLAAQSILTTANTSLDPCDNFFHYACGGWVATHPIPEGATEVSFFRDVFNRSSRATQGLLEQQKDVMFDSEVKAKAFFVQCKNEDAQEKLGAKPLIDMLNDLIGGWPILNPNWNASNFDLLSVLARVRQHGEEPFFALLVDQDRISPSDNVITLSGPNMYYTKDVLLSEAGELYTESFMTFTFNVTALMLVEIGDKRDVSGLAEDLTDQFDMGRYITLSGETALEKRDLSCLKNKTSLGSNQQATFTRSALFRNMTELIKTIFSAVNLTEKITSDTPVILRFPSFFDRMDEKLLELENLGDEGKRRLANYIGWRLIAKNIQYISKAYRDVYDQHIQRVRGNKASKPEEAPARCAAAAKDAFPLALGAMFIRDRLPAGLKAKASVMVDNIRLGFRDLLNNAAWMDNATREFALRKLDDMLYFVGYSDVMVNNISLIDAAYGNMTIEPTYFATLQVLTREKSFQNLRKLVAKNERDDLIGNPVDIIKVNAENTIEKNLVTVTSAILQRPFFEVGNPQYLNYGGIGFVIGHETTHSFDDQGSLYDGVGNMRNWWSNATADAYNQRKKTLVDQYRGFNLSSGHVDGLLTLGENIADNGGMKAAYHGYFDHYQKQLASPEPVLPGFPSNITAEQLFFLSAAQIWCNHMRPESERLALLQDVHSPPEFRVIGPLSNMPEFAQAFNCPVGSRMNPALKRGVW